MEFLNRIKKEMTEGVVRAILAHAGYRVVNLGVEQIVREVECLTPVEYTGLAFPRALQSLPDLLVMDRDQATKHLVEVKYRSRWDVGIFDEIADQALMYDEIVLVYLNAKPPAPLKNGGLRSRGPIESSPNKTNSSVRDPGSHMRCCKIRCQRDEPEALLDCFGSMRWIKLSAVPKHEGQWWGLVPIQNVFPRVQSDKEEATLIQAMKALRGILSV